MKLAVKLDFYLARKDESSVFQRNNRNFQFLERQPRELPLFKKEKIEDILNKKNLHKETIFAVTVKYEICPHRYCYGHFLASYSCCFIRGFLKKHHPSLPSISNDILARNGLNSYFKNYFQIGSEMYKYYSHQFQRKVIQ